MNENRAEVSEQCGNRFGADESCLLPNGHTGWHEGARTTWNGRNHLPLVRTGMRSHGEAEARSESRPSLSRDVDRSAASSMPSSPSSPSAPAALNPSSPERAMGDGKTEGVADVSAVLRECERWIAAVATNGALSGIAAQHVRSEINRLYAALQSRLAEYRTDHENAEATIDTLIAQRDYAQETVRLFGVTYGEPGTVRDLAAANAEIVRLRAALDPGERGADTEIKSLVCARCGHNEQYYRPNGVPVTAPLPDYATVQWYATGLERGELSREEQSRAAALLFQLLAASQSNRPGRGVGEAVDEPVCVTCGLWRSLHGAQNRCPSFDSARLDWLEATVLERDVEMTLTNVDGDIPTGDQPEWVCITPLHEPAITGSDLRAAIDAAMKPIPTTPAAAELKGNED